MLLPIASRTTRTVTVPSAAPMPESRGHGSTTDPACPGRRGTRRERRADPSTPAMASGQTPRACASPWPPPAALAEPRVGIVRRVLARRRRSPSQRRLRRRRRRAAWPRQPLARSRARSARGIRRRRRADASTARPVRSAAAHLGEILLRHLSHRAIEFELLDRPQHQRSSRARAPPACGRRATVTTGSRAMPAKGITCAAPPCRRRPPRTREAEQDDGGRRLPARERTPQSSRPARPASVNSCQG